MNVLLYNSYNLFFPQYLNTESTYQLFCNTALSALLHQSKAYYGGKNVFLWEMIRMGVWGVSYQMRQSAGNTELSFNYGNPLPLHKLTWTQL